MPWRERWTFVSWANNSVGTKSCPTSPGRSAGRSDPTRPWYVRVLDSTGKPFSRKACPGIVSKTRRIVYDALEGKKDGCFLGNRPVGLPSYRAPPRRSAERLPAPDRLRSVQVLDSTIIKASAHRSAARNAKRPWFPSSTARRLRISFPRTCGTQGDSPLVSSQEPQSSPGPADKLVVNRFVCACLGEGFQEGCLRSLRRQGGRSSPERIDPPPSHLALPRPIRPTPPRSPRPARPAPLCPARIVGRLFAVLRATGGVEGAAIRGRAVEGAA